MNVPRGHSYLVADLKFRLSSRASCDDNRRFANFLPCFQFKL
jgi:hypothetical protein